MANKREFKKYAESLAVVTVQEMMVAYYNVEGADKDAISEAVGIVLGAVENAKNHSNIFFDRGPKSFADHKEYAKEKRNFFRALFNKIETEYTEAINTALKKFNGALPLKVKEAQKESVN